MKNKNLIYIVGAAAVAAGLFFLLRKRKPEEELPVLPGMIPGGSPAPAPAPGLPAPAPGLPAPAPGLPAPAPLKIGDVVFSNKTQSGIFEKAIKVFTAGGTNNKGQIEKGKYAGVIRGFTPMSDLVIVENFTNPMRDGNTTYNKFRLDKKFLYKP